MLCCYVEYVHVQVLYLCEHVGTYTSEERRMMYVVYMFTYEGTVCEYVSTCIYRGQKGMMYILCIVYMCDVYVTWYVCYVVCVCMQYVMFMDVCA